MKCRLFSRKFIQYLGGDIRNLTILLLLSLSFGTVTDIDGNVYETVIIGEQLWMAENLKVTHYNNGDEIPTGHSNNAWSNLSIGAYAFPNNDAINTDTYGNLYNWYAVDDSRGLCMEGWHVPTDTEWKALEMYLGMSNTDANNEGWRGTDEGGMLKEGGTEYWLEETCGVATCPDGGTGCNCSGFTALPSGCRFASNGSYSGDTGYYAYIWTSTSYSSYSTGTAYWRWLGREYSTIYRNKDKDRESGFSVRCIAEEIFMGCTNPAACNYDPIAAGDDGTCMFYDCAGICGGDNSSYDGCCGLPPNDDCTDDCVIDDLGQCCIPQDVDGCGVCFGNGDGTDCNNDGIPDDCEEVYSAGYDLGNAEGYTAGLEEGILLGGQSGDANGDGVLNILDIVYFIDVILYP